MNAPEIFDRATRRQRRDRAAAQFDEHAYLRREMLAGIADRLGAITRSFNDVLDLGCFDAAFTLRHARIARCDAGFAFARAAAGVQADEDRLPFADAAFDLVVSAGVLDSVNDLPGALSLIRRVLRPDGLLLAAFVGAGTLVQLRGALKSVGPDRPAARIHPQIDVRGAGDLLVRAGFALPVADVESTTIRFGSPGVMIADLRGMAATSVMPAPPRLSRSDLEAAVAALANAADPDGRIAEHVAIIYLTGWAPAPSQPRAAARGSGTTSLAAALRPRD